MDELFAVLLSWATTLSGYPAPERAPEVVTVPHVFFVNQACGGHECRVYGWYAGGDKLYIDERMDPQSNIVDASVVVHEMVHYLQGIARTGNIPDNGAAYGDKPLCSAAIDMEREAYGVQREFLLRYGVYRRENGRFLPGAVTFRDPTERVTIEVRLQELELDPQLPPDAFELPR